MKFELTLGVSALALMCSLTTPSEAAKKFLTRGPFLDLAANLPQDLPPFQGILITTASGPKCCDVNGNTYGVTDGGMAILNSNNDSTYYRMAGSMYVSSATDAQGDIRGATTITTIYGLNLSPDGEDPVITGYTSSAPEVTFGLETIFGRSHKAYKPRSSEVIAIGDLQSRLGPDFDLSQFQGDPTSVVYLFQTVLPAKDVGLPPKGILLSEDFSHAYHVGFGDFGGSFGPGSIPGTALAVTSGEVDILGVDNGTNGSCTANPSGNCLDLIGNTGNGAVQSLLPYALDPKFVYTIQFDVVAQSVDANIDFNVSLGKFGQKVTATVSAQPVMLTYTPTSSEPAAFFALNSITNLDDEHGPVISNLVLCAHPVGTKSLKCPKS